MTDDTGLFQHAKYITPLRQEGYTTDDNARALTAATLYYAYRPQREALRLIDIYLAFVLHAQDSDGTVRNFMNFDRTWVENEPAHDALGRALWALGTVIAKPPAPAYLSAAKDVFDLSVEHVPNQSPRGMAYSILGLSEYLKQFPQNESVREKLKLAAEKTAERYDQNSSADWQWFEDKLTYDNAVLPHALFVAGSVLDNKQYLKVAKITCEFLLEKTFTGGEIFTAEHAETAEKNHKINSANSAASAVKSGHFSFIGCNGWYKKGKTRAQFDQQPIEAAGTVMMLHAACQATGDNRFKKLQQKAFNWFLGKNDLGVPLYDSATKGCCDGLGPDGINLNQGAESTLSFLLSRLTMRK